MPARISLHTKYNPMKKWLKSCLKIIKSKMLRQPDAAYSCNCIKCNKLVSEKLIHNYTTTVMLYVHQLFSAFLSVLPNYSVISLIIIFLPTCITHQCKNTLTVFAIISNRLVLFTHSHHNVNQLHSCHQYWHFDSRTTVWLFHITVLPHDNLLLI